MDHRGGVGFEKNTGDGAGIMTGIPDKLLRRECRNLMNSELPKAGQYGVGNVFLPNDETERALCKTLIESELEPLNKLSSTLGLSSVENPSTKINSIG